MAWGQSSDLYAPTPVPAAQTITVQAQSLPAVVTPASVFTIKISLATTPAQFSVIVGSASNAEIVKLVLDSANSPAKLASLMAGVSAPTLQKIVDALATSPDAVASFISSQAATGTLSVSISGATGPQLLALLTAADVSPANVQLLLNAIQPEEMMQVVVALEDKIKGQQTVSITVQDVDILVATSMFAGQDSRYRAPSPLSYYGRKLGQLQHKIKAEGMTADNKSAMLQLYKDATASLKQFLVSQPQ